MSSYIIRKEEDWKVLPIENNPICRKYTFLDGSYVSISSRRYCVYVGYLSLKGWKRIDSGILKKEIRKKISTPKITGIMTSKELEVGRNMDNDENLICFDGVRPASYSYGEQKYEYLSLAKKSYIEKDRGYLVDYLDKKYKNPVIIKNVLKDKPNWISGKIAFVKFGKLTPTFKVVYRGIDLKKEIQNLYMYCKNPYIPGYPLPFYGVHILTSKNLEKKMYSLGKDFLKKEMSAGDRRMAWIKDFRGK